VKKQIPPELDRIADTVLAYRPKAKAKASKQRQKAKGQTRCKERLTVLMYISPK
jgi:hypothetical protein